MMETRYTVVEYYTAEDEIIYTPVRSYKEGFSYYTNKFCTGTLAADELVIVDNTTGEVVFMASEVNII